LLDRSFKKSIGPDAGIIVNFQGAFVFVVFDDQMKFGDGCGSHSVRVDMALDMISQVIIREFAYVVQEQGIGQHKQHNPIRDWSIALVQRKDRQLDILFPTGFQPQVANMFHECWEASSVNSYAIKSVPGLNTCILESARDLRYLFFGFHILE
jgi:hypothetical protein